MIPVSSSTRVMVAHPGSLGWIYITVRDSTRRMWQSQTLNDKELRYEVLSSTRQPKSGLCRQKNYNFGVEYDATGYSRGACVIMTHINTSKGTLRHCVADALPAAVSKAPFFNYKSQGMTSYLTQPPAQLHYGQRTKNVPPKNDETNPNLYRNARRASGVYDMNRLDFMAKCIKFQRFRPGRAKPGTFWAERH
jgi:hypothetical protein